MRAILQRVSEASVTIDGEVSGKIDKGLLVLVGMGKEDTDEDIKKLVDKIVKLRLFSDENDKTNLSVRDIGGSLLIVSQFTLYWNCKKGTRPSFDGAMPPEEAKKMYDKFVDYAKSTQIPVQTGVFGADMKVALINDGPVTVTLDTKN